MIRNQFTEYLDSHNIRYSSISHSQAFTAQEIAMTAHISGDQLAKTVIIKVDGKSMMAVVPASDMIDFRLLKNALGVTTATLATEDDFKGMFPGCEVGAMPPFGNLYHMGVIVADDLALDDEIAFNAGNHRELIRMAYKDFERLVGPKVARISVRKEVHHEDLNERF